MYKGLEAGTCLVRSKSSEDTSVPGLERTGPLGDEVRGPVWRDTSCRVLEASNDFGFSLNEMPLKGLNRGAITLKSAFHKHWYQVLPRIWSHGTLCKMWVAM